MPVISVKLESFAVSDIGCVRQNNEDVWAEKKEKQFFALADGMGGHRAGEIAAALAIESVCNVVSEIPLSREKIEAALKEGFLKANSLVYKLSCEKEEWRGMGTTLCCFLLFENTLFYGHVGDSRIYRYRNKRLKRLTEDHSLRSELIAKGELSESEASNFPYKNIITRAIGTTPDVEPALASTDVLTGDIYFLSTDGLTDYVSEEEIEEILGADRGIKERSLRLVERAKKHGGNDNISIVMIRVVPC